MGRLKMPMTCAAFGCNTKFSTESKRKGISFHKFPLSNPDLLEKWRLAVRRASITGGLWTPTRHHCLCSLHFQEHCFEIAGLIRRLREGAVPTIFNFPRSAQPKDRLGRRKRKAPIGVILATRDVVRQEHSYSVPDVETLKRRLQFSEEDRAQKERQLRNARERETRLRQICATIKRELSEKNLLTKQLQKKLEQYEEVPTQLELEEKIQQQKSFSWSPVQKKEEEILFPIEAHGKPPPGNPVTEPSRGRICGKESTSQVKTSINPAKSRKVSESVLGTDVKS